MTITHFDYSGVSPATSRLVDGITSRTAKLNEIFDLISDAFNQLVFYGSCSGSANAYLVTLQSPPAAYYDGMRILFKAPADNDGASTVNVNSLGVKTVTRQSGASLERGDILLSRIVECIYNSTTGKFEIISSTADVALASCVGSIAALVAASGVKTSTADTTIGTTSTKILNTDGSAFGINNAGGNETLTIPIVPSFLTKTQADSPYSVLDDSLKKNKVHDNSGASGECIFQLGAAFDGAIFRGEVKAAQYLQLKAGTGQTITFGSDVTASGGYIRCDKVGATVGARLKGTVWTVFEMTEYWRKDI